MVHAVIAPLRKKGQDGQEFKASTTKHIQGHKRPCCKKKKIKKGREGRRKEERTNRRKKEGKKKTANLS